MILNGLVSLCRAAMAAIVVHFCKKSSRDLDKRAAVYVNSRRNYFMKKLTVFILSLIVLIGFFLRTYNISTNPPGLYIDEVSIGLNAYDIFKTGKDQYGVAHPLIFKSYGDYKVPGYIYIVAASMAIFGKNEFAIRFPSALAGTLTILVLFFFTRELLSLHEKTKKHAGNVALLVAGIFAITPWHIHFSRGGFEAVVSLFFYTLALFLGLRFWQTKRVWYLLVVSLIFIAAMYTYDAYRLLVPLTAAVGFFLGLRDKEKRLSIVVCSILLALLALPLFMYSLTANGQMRFLQTSAFAENPYTAGSTRILGDVVLFIRNYLSYFSLTFLFRFGDQINRHQVNDLGILYLWQLPCIIAGVYFLTKVKNKMLSFFVYLLLLVGAIPASIARPSPHTLRFLMASVPYTILTALGIFQLILQKKKWVKIVLVGIGIVALVEIGYYFHYYYVHYPKEALIDWGGSCKETALVMQSQNKRYQHIVIDKNIGCLREYFLFYAPHVPIAYVSPDWKKPLSWGNDAVLYIRPFYGNPSPDNLVENIYLPNVNHDIFTQFIKL